MPLDPPVLTTERLVVRFATRADVPAILHYFHENEAHLAGSRPLPPADFYTEAFWERFVDLALAELRQDRAARFFAFAAGDAGVVVGSATLTQIFRGPAQYCVLGYGLGKAFEGRGLMRETLEAVIGYGFGELNLHRIMANHVPRNERSGGLLRRLGFVVEGYARDYLLLDGRWEDHVLTSLTNPDWRAE
jgi:[ribosomal protein S5]-alanine N-acetyltransferase